LISNLNFKYNFQNAINKLRTIKDRESTAIMLVRFNKWLLIIIHFPFNNPINDMTSDNDNVMLISIVSFINVKMLIVTSMRVAAFTQFSYL
jgi:hypothetical protein